MPGLDSDQLAALAAAVDGLAPADEGGPGGVAMGVVDYVSAALAEGGRRPEWDAGLAALDACAEARHGMPFAALASAERDAILADFERGEAGTGVAAEAAFFELLRDHVLQGMFGDPRHGGNRDGAGWVLLGYPGPRLLWSEAEQRLDAAPAPASPAGGGGG